MKGKERRPLIQKVAALAMQLGRRHLADYGATRSRHDFTQRQLMACLVLRAYLKTTYRGVLELFSVSPSLRAELGLSDKLPHFTTLQKFSARSKVLEIADAMIQTIGGAAGEPAFGANEVAMDSTGMQPTTASQYFQCSRGGQKRNWVKISTIVLCGSLLPLSVVIDWGPNSDKCQAQELITKASQASLPAKLYADAGYDAEWIHEQCRSEWGVESVIKPIIRRADGRLGGFWRSAMSKRYLKRKRYGKRWAVETFFSGLKRTMGSTLSARKPGQLLHEAPFECWPTPFAGRRTLTHQMFSTEQDCLKR